MKFYKNKTSPKRLQASKNKALILDIHGGIFHFNHIWGIVSKADRTHRSVFSCRVTFSRWTEKSINKVALAPYFIAYFLFILSSSGCGNPFMYVYIDIYKRTYLCVAECSSPGHVRKPQAWHNPVTRQVKHQSDPGVAFAAAEPQPAERPLCAGSRRALPPPQGRPHHPTPPPGVPEGTPGCCGVARSTPTSLSPQEFLALSLHAWHPLIPAALAQMGGNPTLEEIREPEIAAFRITKRKWRNLIHSHPLRCWVSIRPYTTF